MVIKSVLSMSATNIAKAIVSFAFSMVLARFVPPEQFGLVAFSLPFVALLTLLTDFGLSTILIRERILDPEASGAIICCMILCGSALSGLLAVFAPAIEHLSRLAGLTPVLRGFALVTMLAISAIAPRGLLERSLRYSLIAAVELSALAAGVAIFVTVLVRGGGVFALVGYHICFNAVRFVAFGAAALPSFRPSLRLRSVIPLLRDGGLVMTTNVMSFVARNVDNLLVGAFLGSKALGLYGLSYQFMTLPLVLLSWPASGVLLAILSKMDSRMDRTSLISAAISLTANITFPLMTFVGLALDFPIRHFYSSHWAGLPQIILWLAPVGAIQSIAVYNGPVLIERRKMKLNFILGMVNGVGLGLVFVFSVFFNLMVLVMSYTVAAIMVSGILLYYTCRIGEVTARQFCQSLLPSTTACLVAVAALYLTRSLSPDSVLQWVQSTLIFGITVAAVYFLFRKDILGDAHKMSVANKLRQAQA